MRYTAFADIAARLENFTLAVGHVAERAPADASEIAASRSGQSLPVSCPVQRTAERITSAPLIPPNTFLPMARPPGFA